MTVLDWLKSINGFNLGETSLTVIANTRGISTPEVAEYSVLTAMQRELMSADLILNYVLFQPTTTGSISQSHNGFQQTIGSYSDANVNKRISFAKSIYRKYNDANLAMLNDFGGGIRVLTLESDL